MNHAGWEGAGSGGPQQFAPAFPWQSFPPPRRFCSQPKLLPGEQAPLPRGLGSPSLAWDASLEEGGFAEAPEHPARTGLTARWQRWWLRPHPSPTQATSPLTCCAIPCQPPPPTNAAASARKSSPTAPVIPVLPTHAPLPGLLRPNLPWELLPPQKKMHQITANKSARVEHGRFPSSLGSKLCFLQKETCLAPSHGRATASCELPVARRRSPGSQAPAWVPGHRLPNAGSPPWQPELKNIPTTERG